jgi:ferric-dicitrate binding protein FerR (iron transport regulator)
LNGSRFKVISQSQEVEVLGTEFNIKAYKNENLTYTTLVEGKVDVNSKGVKRRLKPNQQLSLNLKTDQFNISFVDVFSEISWKDGIFSFEDKSLHDIMKVISRWYDIEVVFENENVKKEEFFGLLRKDQELEKIMFTIKEYGIIENYEFNNKILTIK